MGIENREYLREDSPRGGFGPSGGDVVTKLIIATVVVFVLQVLFQRSPLTHWLAMNIDAVRQAQLWRFVTYAFCHDTGDLLHILFNMLFLWWFGRTLEGMYRSREFLLFYLTAAVVASVFYLLLTALPGPESSMIGASGAVYAVMMLYTMHFPRQTIMLMFVIPVEIRWLVLAWVAFSVYGVLSELGNPGNSSGVAESAHLGGLAFGYAYHRFRWRLEDSWPKFGRIRFRRPRFGRRLKIYEPPSREQMEARVDALLDKIQDKGEASLTDEERRFLREASKQYKKR